MSLFRMDEKSNQFLHDYAKFLGKNYVASERKRFAFLISLEHGQKPPPEEEGDIVTCNITNLVMRPRMDGKAGRDVVITFTAYVDGEEENYHLRTRAINEQNMTEKPPRKWMTDPLTLLASPELDEYKIVAQCEGAWNELVIGQFNKLTIPDISSFNELKANMEDTGFFLYRDGFTPSDDESEDEEESTS